MSTSIPPSRSVTGTPAGPRAASAIDARPPATTPPRPEERLEGPVATAIEKQTSKLPSDWFLWGALGALSVSLALQASGQRHRGLAVGQLAPTLLILGLYNKLVKVAGSDQYTTERQPL